MTKRPSGLLWRLYRLGQDERGVSAVEYALVLPFILILLSGAIDLGYALNQSSSLSGAARAGAQYGMRFPSDDAGIKDVVKKAVSYDPDSLTVTTKMTCECEDGTVLACTDTCAGATPITYLTVHVSKTYSSPLPTAMMLGITTLSSSAVMRAN
jgi:Flp pilus assembly protein TadG